MLSTTFKVHANAIENDALGPTYHMGRQWKPPTLATMHSAILPLINMEPVLNLLHPYPAS